MLRITGAQTIARVEEEMMRISAARGDDLQIPVHPKEWWLGGELGLIEMVITWARRNETAALVTHIRGADDAAAQLKSMSKRMFGFVALMMAPDIKDISGTRSLRKEAYEQCRNVVDLMHGPLSRQSFGGKIFFICVDHSTRWGIPSLYSPDLSVKDGGEFATLAREMVDKLTQGTGDETIPDPSIRSFGKILQELFRNTHEWARTDAADIPWRRSVRGISSETHSWTGSDLDKVVVDNPAMQDYIRAFRAGNDGDRLRFFEFTVFDGGIGRARRWLGATLAATLPLDEEYEACLECLKKHRTTSKLSYRGMGLAEVMSTLSGLRGFLKIRTGRLAIYRDFANSPLVDADDSIRLDDFQSRSSTLTGLAPVFGTHFQIIIPATGRA